ncbi:mucin-17-like isoform X2 [Corticium candelabrum]|uniref:mucin-17-like isoform X2 n=1 Tax=Corticium candelabrum TaxID=121492 RepID=UPI002E255B3B|nr:mucin-17-like isoform X2 [Corticium candelabrum]
MLVVQLLWLTFLKRSLGNSLKCDDLPPSKSTELVDCYALVNSSVTMNCTYRGMNAHRLTGPFWNIQFSNSTVNSVVSAIDSLPGFTFLSALKNYTELTIDQVSENLNMSTIQCQFDIRFTNDPEAGSGKIKVLLGSLPTISCKPHLCTSVNSSKAEIPCEVSGTPIPSTKIELNSAGTSVPDDSSQFSIHRADSLMPILTIDPVNCTLDAGNNYRISSENILGTSLPYQWNDSHVLDLDNDDSSDCQVIGNTTRLTCSFSLARFPTTNIVWNISKNNIINKTSNIDVCACRVTSTVFVSLQHVSASTSCTASYNDDMVTQYPFKQSTPSPPVTSIPTSVTSSPITSRDSKSTSSGSTTTPVTSGKETSKDDQPAWLIPVIVVVVVAVIIIIIAVVAFIIWKKSKESTTTDNGTHVKLQGVTPHDTAVESVQYAETGPATAPDEIEAYAVTTGAKQSTMQGQGANKSKTAKDKTNPGPPTETYALPDKSKKTKNQKADTAGEEYSQVEKQNKKSNQPLTYADLDQTSFKQSTTQRPNQSVTYSEMNELQPSAKTK